MIKTVFVNMEIAENSAFGFLTSRVAQEVHQDKASPLLSDLWKARSCDGLITPPNGRVLIWAYPGEEKQLR